MDFQELNYRRILWRTKHWWAELYIKLGGAALIGGSKYSVAQGRTLIGGTGYDISFWKLKHELLSTGKPATSTSAAAVTIQVPDADKAIAFYALTDNYAGSKYYTTLSIGVLRNGYLCSVPGSGTSHASFESFTNGSLTFKTYSPNATSSCLYRIFAVYVNGMSVSWTNGVITLPRYTAAVTVDCPANALFLIGNCANGSSGYQEITTSAEHGSFITSDGSFAANGETTAYVTEGQMPNYGQLRLMDSGGTTKIYCQAGSDSKARQESYSAMIVS